MTKCHRNEERRVRGQERTCSTRSFLMASSALMNLDASIKDESVAM